VAARERWVAAATEILGTPVVETVPVARRRPAAVLLFIACLAVGFVVVLLYEFGVVAGPRFPMYFAGPVAVVVALQLGAEQLFAAQSRDGGVWMLTGSRMSPRPLALIGPLDPEQVRGPEGVLGTTFVIAGVKHQVAVPQRARFQQMVETARRRPTG
jgi:hypothetical protein